MRLLKWTRRPLKGIFRKTFLSILLLMAGCFLIEIIFQGSLIATLYQKASIRAATNTLDTAINAVKAYWADGNDDDGTLYEALDNIYYPLAVFDEKGDLLAFPYADNLTSLNIQTAEGEQYHIIFDPKDYPTLSFYQLISGKTLSTYCIKLWNSNYVLPLSFSYNGQSYSSSANISQWRRNISNSNITSTHISGRLVSISNYYTFTPQNHHISMALFKSLSYDFLAEQNLADIYQKHYKSDPVAEEYMIIAKQIYRNEKNYYFFTAKYIDDLSFSYLLLQKYNIALYPVFLVVIAIASFYLSHRITSPLICLDNQAKRIASLDFSEKITMNTGDELEDLSKSLNSIAKNMSQALDDLNREAVRSYEGEKRIRNLLTEMSHEFKTPLNIIASAGSILGDGLCEKEPSYYTDIITAQCKKLSTMVNDVITLSHLEGEYYVFEPTRFDITHLIEQMVSLYQDSISRDLHTIVLDCTKQVFVCADAKRIEQVLQNFISNASHYAPPRTDITITLKILDDQNAYVEVSNQGSLNVEDSTIIWQPFYHKPSEYPHIRECGSGIGLSICAQILDLHKSKYGVREQDGRVSFYFTLPTELPDPSQ